MYCEECEKRPANVHLTKIVNGQKKEMHLCEQCAKKQQDQIGFTLVPDFSFSNFLTSMLEGETFAPFGTFNKEKESKCEKCGLTYSMFTKIGRMGCDKCYEVYGDKLEHLLKRVHGNTQHVGKIPRRTGENIRMRKELMEARASLQKAVLNEEFEKAAQLRDRIKELEKNRDDKGGFDNDK
ncbi:MAG: UvrB/UvrC motif-containing protein [Bacillota bacterium]